MATLASGNATAAAAATLGAGIADRESDRGSAVQLLGCQFLVELTHGVVLLLNFYLLELIHNS